MACIPKHEYIAKGIYHSTSTYIILIILIIIVGSSHSIMMFVSGGRICWYNTITQKSLTCTNTWLHLPWWIQPNATTQSLFTYLKACLHLLPSQYVASCWHLWATTRAKQTCQRLGANGASDKGAQQGQFTSFFGESQHGMLIQIYRFNSKFGKSHKVILMAATLALIKDFLDYLTIHQIKVCGWDTFPIHTKLSVWRIQAWIITFQFSGVWLQRVLSHGTWHTGDTSAGVGFVHRKVWGLRIGTLIPSLGWPKNDQSLCFCRLEISTSPEHSP